MLQPVAQLSHTGCFIACVAMLLGKSYREAFSLLRPGKDMDAMYSHGFQTNNIEKTSHRLLRKLGFKTHTGKYRKVRSYQERMKKNTIMIIRWNENSPSCHCILFDADGKRFIDPSGGYIVERKFELRNLQQRLAVPIVIDKTPRLVIPSDIPRSPTPHRISWGDNNVRQDSHHSDGQVPLRESFWWRMASEGTTSDYDWD